MFLNENFLQIWEELSELNEAKADTQKLIDFAGQELADRFLAVKNKLKSPENDLYYWIKNKSSEELEQAVDKAENTKSNTQVKKEVDQGAKLVCSSEHWNVYHITTFEASQKYGRDTKWCITGINNWGDRYWNEYTENGVQFYFLITKGEYDPRGKYSKIAIAAVEQTTGGYSCEVFNQQDTHMLLNNIPYIEEIKIPGIDLSKIDNRVVCFECGIEVKPEEIFYGPHEEYYCKDCFDNTYFRCKKCNELDYAYIAYYEDEHGDKFCIDCYDYSYRSDKLNQLVDKITKNAEATGKLSKEDITIFNYKVYSEKPYMNFTGIATSKEDLHRRIINAISNNTRESTETTTVTIFSAVFGEVIYDKTGVSPNTTKEIDNAVDKFLDSYTDFSINKE